MQVFAGIDIKRDWVCCTWRNHYQALLKGIPPDVVRAEILAGRSMVMNLPEYKFVCSSIVGGIPSIATGLALAAKLQNTGEHVWCWTGDMSAETGAWHEAYKYSVNHQLPITFVVEDNNKSVCTDTRKVWNTVDLTFNENKEKIIHYSYQSRYPHAGAGKRIQF